MRQIGVYTCPTCDVEFRRDKGQVAYWARRTDRGPFCSHTCDVKSRPPRAQRPLAEILWVSVDKSGDCWVWTKSTRYGYGMFARRENGKTKHYLAHRVSWELANGPIPEGLQVLHHCDNPPCVRPDHLFLGTQFDNMQDAAAKGRLWMQKESAIDRLDAVLGAVG